MRTNIALGQFKPTLNVSKNLKKLVKMITEGSEKDFMVMPEGCIS